MGVDIPVTYEYWLLSTLMILFASMIYTTDVNCLTSYMDDRTHYQSLYIYWKEKNAPDHSCY